MQEKPFWHPARHPLLTAHLLVYGAILLLFGAYHPKLLWAGKTMKGYLWTDQFDPTADLLLIKRAASVMSANEEEAESLLLSAVRIDPHSRARLTLGTLYAERGENDKAVEYLQGYLSAHPDALEGYLRLLKVLEDQGDSEAADRLLERGIQYFSRRVEAYEPQIDPTVADRYNNRAHALHRSYSRALKRLQERASRPATRP